MNWRIPLSAGMAAILASCAVPLPPVSVTRTHLGTQILPGTVRIDSQVTNASAPAESLTYTAALANALGRRGFTSPAMGDPVNWVAKAEATRSNLGGTIALKLRVRLLDAKQMQVWDGTATTTARVNSPAAQPGLAAEKLADALFADFPGESGRTITIP